MAFAKLEIECSMQQFGNKHSRNHNVMDEVCECR